MVRRVRGGAGGSQRHEKGRPPAAARPEAARTTTPHPAQAALSRRGSGFSKRRQVTPFVVFAQWVLVVGDVARVYLGGAMPRDQRRRARRRRRRRPERLGTTGGRRGDCPRRQSCSPGFVPCHHYATVMRSGRPSPTCLGAVQFDVTADGGRCGCIPLTPQRRTQTYIHPAIEIYSKCVQAPSRHRRGGTRRGAGGDGDSHYERDS